MEPIEQIRAALAAFDAVVWSRCGGPLPLSMDREQRSPGWVQLGLERSEAGWRTLEALAWACEDMRRSGERVRFYPTAPPPGAAGPGEGLAFVLECYPEGGDQEERFGRIAAFLAWARTQSAGARPGAGP
ncbi:MAG: hypothetical protein Kow0092_03980 [Deferrisomatales bacterium]